MSEPQTDDAEPPRPPAHHMSTPAVASCKSAAPRPCHFPSSRGSLAGPPERPLPRLTARSSTAADVWSRPRSHVFIDPQNDVLSEKGAAWPAMRASGTTRPSRTWNVYLPGCEAEWVFISPHYFYPTDSGWKFNGPLESNEFSDNMFARRGALSLDGCFRVRGGLARAFQGLDRGWENDRRQSS